jgi:cephalosporin hydroxylase
VKGYTEPRDIPREHYAEILESVEVCGAYYNYISKFNRGEYEPRWRGVRVVKLPTDLILYAQVIFKHKPDWIIETGTRFGGSALFFADMLMLTGGKGVVTIDVKPHHTLKMHPLVEYVTRSSTDLREYRKLRSWLKGRGKVMVVLDSDHHTEHVAREMELYSQLVSVGQYLVVEDCWAYKPTPYPPFFAVEEFLAKRDDFERKDLTKQFVFGITRDGWLLRKK